MPKHELHIFINLRSRKNLIWSEVYWCWCCLRVWECFIITWAASVIKVLCRVSLKVSLFIKCHLFPQWAILLLALVKRIVKIVDVVLEIISVTLFWYRVSWVDLWCSDITVIEIIVTSETVLTRLSRKSEDKKPPPTICSFSSGIVLQYRVVRISPVLQLES